MRFPNDSSFDEIRLGFVIVDDKRRGQGCGKEMLSLAIKYAFDFVKVKKISLGVFENNEIAIKCYESCGFKRVKLETTESYHCMGEVWNCIEMELIDFSKAEKEKLADTEDVLAISERLIKQNMEAYEVLAK